MDHLSIEGGGHNSSLNEHIDIGCGAERESRCARKAHNDPRRLRSSVGTWIVGRRSGEKGDAREKCEKEISEANDESSRLKWTRLQLRRSRMMCRGEGRTIAIATRVDAAMRSEGGRVDCDSTTASRCSLTSRTALWVDVRSSVTTR